MYICLYIYFSVCVCYTYTDMCIYIFMYIYIDSYMYIYMYIYVYAVTCTRICAPRGSCAATSSPSARSPSFFHPMESLSDVARQVSRFANLV